MEKRKRERIRPIDQQVETEVSFINTATLIRFKHNDNTYEEVLTQKFLGVEIEFKLSIMWPGAEKVAERMLTKHELRSLVAFSLNTNSISIY
jgi:hypothetical protein